MRRSFARCALAVIASATFLSPVARAEIVRDSKNNIYISGADVVNGQVTVNLGGKMTRQVRPGFCGEIVISPSQAIPNPGDDFTVGEGASAQTFNSTAIAALPLDDDAKCVNATLQNAPASGGWRTSSGKIVLIGSPAFAPGIRVSLQYNDLPNAVTRKANPCGFVRLTNSPTSPLPATIGINGVSTTISSLTLANPPRCFRSEVSAGAYVLYTAP